MGNHYVHYAWANGDYDTVIKRAVNGSAQPAGLTAQPGSPMGAPIPL
jgi:hypothetical protein